MKLNTMSPIGTVHEVAKDTRSAQTSATIDQPTQLGVGGVQNYHETKPKGWAAKSIQPRFSCSRYQYW